MKTVIWVEAEWLDEHDTADLAAVRGVFEQKIADAGGKPLADALVAAAFDDAAAAAEAAIVGQWSVQRLEEHPCVKVRVGVHADADREAATIGAAALCEVANGNQIIMSGAVDTATGGVVDARPMGIVDLDGLGGPTQLWLVTDSRPDVDRRPLRIPTTD